MKNGKTRNNRKKTHGSPRADREGRGWDPKVYDIGLRAFERDLPQLLNTHPRQWVVYHGERRIGPFMKPERLDRICKDENIPVGERVYRVVEPESIEDTVAL